MGWTHDFDEDFAIEHGLHEAIVYRHLCRWIRHNKANGINEYDGRTWTYNTRKAWQQLLPFLTEKQVRTALDNLRGAHVVITGHYGSDPRDRTLWYAIEDDDALALGGQSARPREADPLAAEGQSSTTPSYKTSTTTTIAVATAPADKPGHAYRVFSDLFVERSGHKWAVGSKEGACLAKLVRWARDEQPARWEEYLRAFMDGAWRLKRGDLVGMRDFDRRRWESMPYTPSALLNQCAAIVAALDTLQADPPDAAAIARSMLAEVGK